MNTLLQQTIRIQKLPGWMSLLFACLLTGGQITGVYAQQPSALPNLVYILADDLGFGDVGMYNKAAKVKTPNIDRLAQQGMRFTNAHTTSSVCTPSRYSLLTGRYPWRSRLPVGVLYGYSRTLIEPGTPTVASLLQAKNYTTAVVGKWHLGLDWVLNEAHKDSIDPRFNTQNLYGIRAEMNPAHIDFSKPPTGGPTGAGFDYSYILPASLDMPPYCYLENNKLTAPLTSSTPGNKLETGYTGAFWRAGLMNPSYDFYNVLPTFTQKANAFLEQQHGAAKPFFLYFPMPAPHTPWVPAAAFAGSSQAGEYGDYVQQVDAAVGTLLHTLDSLGLAKNTIVIFTSDNGPYWRENLVNEFGHKAAGEWRGMKGDAHEGGHRVPFIVRYPEKVNANTVSNAPTTLANLVATCSDFTNQHGSVHAEDSYSIWPLLTGKATTVAVQPAIINMSSRGYYNITKGDWKLIVGLGSGGFTVPAVIQPKVGEAPGQLYNLANDPAERNNVYAKNPAVVKELSNLLQSIRQAEAGKQYVKGK